MEFRTIPEAPIACPACGEYDLGAAGEFHAVSVTAGENLQDEHEMLWQEYQCHGCGKAFLY